MKDRDDLALDGGEDEPVPQLTPEIVDDEQAVAEVVDLLIATEPEARARLHEIVLHQQVVRESVDADLWQLLLRLDEMIVERWADLAVKIARWAFNEGRISGEVPDDRPRGGA